MEAKLIDRCRTLAETASKAYRNAHGGRSPTVGGDSDSAFDVAWGTGWTALQQQGATARDESSAGNYSPSTFHARARRWRRLTTPLPCS